MDEKFARAITTLIEQLGPEQRVFLALRAIVALKPEEREALLRPLLESR
jgi:hypothetical protein